MAGMGLLYQDLLKLIEECKNLLNDLRFYDVPSGRDLQIRVDQKIRQLQGIQYMLEEREQSTRIDSKDTRQVLRDIRFDLGRLSTKWKREVEDQYRSRKLRQGKLFFMSSL